MAPYNLWSVPARGYQVSLQPRSLLPLFATVLVFATLGCSRIPDDGVRFAEVTASQPITIEDFSGLRFTDKDGNEIALSEVMTRDYLVLVITRGWYGGVCFYCASQTSRWARRFDELDPYNAQLVVIFPTETDEDAPKLSELTKRIKGGDIPNEDIPYPILLDINLTGVDQLGIRAELAKPSTYIIDRQGRVRFAYVGESIADRPTVDSVLRQLEQLNR
ncbi:MAG: redoxin domain-containing protein [Phycisphaera sp. RhM]|nr:redoxin domain-containing protein [Phycisphaera sp. RhM]